MSLVIPFALVYKMCYYKNTYGFTLSKNPQGAGCRPIFLIPRQSGKEADNEQKAPKARVLRTGLVFGIEQKKALH